MTDINKIQEYDWKKALEEEIKDKENNPIIDIAFFNGKDNIDCEVVNISVQKVRGKYRVYLNYDKERPAVIEDKMDEVKDKIEANWGNWATFKWITC